jgi:hypothetical protein
MSFQDDDTIWIIDAPRAVIESVEEAVGYAWPQGVQKSGPLSKEPGCWAIQIKGTPCELSAGFSPRESSAALILTLSFPAPQQGRHIATRSRSRPGSCTFIYCVQSTCRDSS